MLLATRTENRCVVTARRAYAQGLAASGHASLAAVVETSERGERAHVDCEVLDALGGRCAGIRLSFDSAPPVAWIGELHVAPERRSAGIGAALALAAEEIAQRRLAEAIGVFPLTGSLPFWRRLGYAPHPRRSRVLFKPLLPPPDPTG